MNKTQMDWVIDRFWIKTSVLVPPPYIVPPTLQLSKDKDFVKYTGCKKRFKKYIKIFFS